MKRFTGSCYEDNMEINGGLRQEDTRPAGQSRYSLGVHLASGSQESTIKETSSALSLVLSLSLCIERVKTEM